MSQDGSNGSTKDHDNDSDDIKPTNHEAKARKKATKHNGSSRDVSHGSDTDGRLTVCKSADRHRSVDIQKSKTMSGPSSTVDINSEAQLRGAENRASATENTGLLSVSTASANVMVTRSHQDLAGNYMRFSPHPSSSRLSSHADLRGYDPANRRTTKTMSLSSSVASGLDDDDYIDPHRDVGIAVCIRDGYFSWLPRANGEALMSDINFVADAG